MRPTRPRGRVVAVTGAVLITAATGTVGRHVVRTLADEDCETRAATRDPDAASERRGDAASGPLDDADAVVAFDFDRPETWGGALEGVDGVFLVRPPGVDEDDLTSFVDAAARVGVDRVAYLSTLGADRNVLIPHHRIERHLRDASVDYTFLRASFFPQNLHEVHRREIVERDEIFVPAGSGKTSFVDARDVGAVGAPTWQRCSPRCWIGRSSTPIRRSRRSSPGCDPGASRSATCC